MSRKREKPYFSFFSRKRRHHLPLPDKPPSDSKSPATVLVTGIPTECSLMELKSRFEIYGTISRTTVQPGGVAYVTFRSFNSATSAVDAALDTSFPITLHSVSVQVTWATNSVPPWRKSVSQKDISPNSFSSKLVRPEVPLSRHGRGKRLGSAIVNPRAENTDSVSTMVAFKGREIIAYDDIL